MTQKSKINEDTTTIAIYNSDKIKLDKLCKKSETYRDKIREILNEREKKENL